MSDAIVVGDARPFIAALIALDPEAVDAVTRPGKPE